MYWICLKSCIFGMCCIFITVCELKLSYGIFFRKNIFGQDFLLFYHKMALNLPKFAEFYCFLAKKIFSDKTSWMTQYIFSCKLNLFVVRDTLESLVTFYRLVFNTEGREYHKIPYFSQISLILTRSMPTLWYLRPCLLITKRWNVMKLSKLSLTINRFNLQEKLLGVIQLVFSPKNFLSKKQ